MKPNIELHIEELVLHGFAPSERRRIGKAVERELARLFAERGVPSWLAQGGEFPRLNAGTFDVPPTSGPDEIGARIARSVSGALHR